MQLGALTEFPILGYVARRSFSTLTSVCFDLGVYKEFSFFPEGTDLPIEAFHLKGWLEVHHPCDGHIKVQIRLSVPSAFEEWDTAEAVRGTLFTHLGIPDDETWEMVVFEPHRSFSFIQHVDRDGMTDRV